MTNSAKAKVVEASSDESMKSWKFVTHQYPDTDAWACLWAAQKFVSTSNEDESLFLAAGSRLSLEEEEAYNVLYMDTGGGELDQHGKFLKRGSSFQLFAKRYGFEDDPGIAPILELTIATDNVEVIEPTSVHYYFKGLPYFLYDKETREVDWLEVRIRVFEVLDIMYSQASMRADSIQRFQKEGRTYTLPNNLKVASIWWKPQLREAAYDAGNDVVMWTQFSKESKDYFSVGIQVNRRSGVQLAQLIGVLRFAEAAKRDIRLKHKEAYAFGTIDQIPGWFLHDSGKLIVCGSRSSPLEGDEHTRLSALEILKILRTELGKLNIQV